LEQVLQSNAGFRDTVEEMMYNQDCIMFFDECDSVLQIDLDYLKPHHWRGPQTFSTLCNPKAPGPFTMSFSHGKFEIGRNMWGGSGLCDIIDNAVGTAYMLKAASFLGHALDESERNAEKMRQEAIRENEEWSLSLHNAIAHSIIVDEDLLPPDAS